MSRKQGLASAASILPDLPERSTDPGHIQALRRNSRAFTLADQVDRLVAASEADPDRGFLGRTMALCSLPRTNPGNRLQYKRRNGPFTLGMIAGLNNKLPFGTNPRLILAWVCTEAVRTGSREIVLGRSLSEFMRKLGISSTDGRGQARLRNQMKRLFGCSVTLIYEDAQIDVTASSFIADHSVFWWNERKPGESSVWNSKVRLSESFFNEIVSHPVPLDLTTPQGPQTLSFGPRSLLMAGLPDPSPCAPRNISPGRTCTGNLERPRPKPMTRTLFNPSAPRFCAN